MSKKVYFLEIDEEDLDEYLIGIHSVKESFEIAFYLNRTANARFKKTSDNLSNEKRQGLFDQFKWLDTKTDLECTLFSNKWVQENKTASSNNNNTLFEMPIRNELSLLPEFKHIDFFIKSNHFQIINLLQTRLKMWSEVSLVYEIEMETIRNRMNLIFD
ncbi:MAG: IPExxxVDY family protein [Flavobacteriaceae bacterium]